MTLKMITNSLTTLLKRSFQLKTPTVLTIQACPQLAEGANELFE